MGTINNLIHVKKSDFEVFDALKVDSLESSETSGRGEFLWHWSFACAIFHLLCSETCCSGGEQTPRAEPWACTREE